MTSIWASGEQYEPYVGRWSRLVAPRFVAWLDQPAGARWLDVGAGTGALTEAVLADAAAGRVACVEPSEAYLAHLRARHPELRSERAGAEELPFEDGSFDVVVSGLVLNFVSDPVAGVHEMARTVSPDGVVAAYVWDYLDGMQPIRFFWDEARALDPRAEELDEGERFPLCHRERLSALFSGCGLAAVEARAIEVPAVFRDFDDYWTPFLGAQGPAPAYAASLTEGERARLREALRERLASEADGSIALVARAWAVKGVVKPTQRL